MAKTGPQRYPDASTAYWHQDRYGGSSMESNVGVLHTTEGTTVPSYGGGASAPNFTALPDIGNQRLRWYQHFDFDVSSRALRNISGGVETNTLNAVQVELVGTCDPRHRSSWGSRRAGVHYLFWPEAPDWALRELGEFVRWCHEAHGVRMESSVRWRPYPSSYGAHADRLSDARWRGYYGWLGHQHVPENSHGDPGDLDFARVLEHARGGAAVREPRSEEGDDMPKFVNLGRVEPLVVQAGRWEPVAYDSLWLDETGEHAGGGSWAVRGPAAFTGSVGVSVDGLPIGHQLQVRVVEVGGGEEPKPQSALAEVIGTPGDAYQVVPVDGLVPDGRAIRVEVQHWEDSPVQVRAYFRAHVWER